MNITFFNIRYYNNQIKINNKKKNYCIYINKCNQYCNNVNPIYCNNCLYSIESEPNLNFHFSDYILVNNFNNDYYHVLRNSTNNLNKFNNYCNNFQNENYYDPQANYYLQNNEMLNNENNYQNEYLNNENDYQNEYLNNENDYQNKYLNNENDYQNEYLNNENDYQNENHENLNYNFDNESISEISIEEEEIILDKNYNFDNESISEISFEEEEIILDNNKINNNSEISFEKENTEIIKNYEISNDEQKQVKDEISLEDTSLEKINQVVPICENKVLKLSNKEKKNLKKKRKNDKKKLEKIKEDEETKLLEEMQNLNRINFLERFSKIGLDDGELKIINSLSYNELKDKYERPIFYDIKNKLLELYNLKNPHVLLNMNIYDDFKDFELSEKDTVDRIILYLKKSKFNKFYFNSVYELIYFGKLIIFIKDKNNKILDDTLTDNSNEIIFYEEILEKEIIEYFREYMIKVLIIPFLKKKKEELKNKYQEYEDKLYRKKKITFQESLLISYKNMINVGGNMFFGKKGKFVFDKDNNVTKNYYF